jgi:hypothetical protein
MAGDSGGLEICGLMTGAFPVMLFSASLAFSWLSHYVT